jgi:O-antigen ligase
MFAAIDFSNPVTVSLVLTGIVAAAGYGAFIVVPAWGSYGRVWERIAASFLTLFILAAMIGLGTALGGAIVWFYDQYS